MTHLIIELEKSVPLELSREVFTFMSLIDYLFSDREPCTTIDFMEIVREVQNWNTCIKIKYPQYDFKLICRCEEKVEDEDGNFNISSMNRSYEYDNRGINQGVI